MNATLKSIAGAVGSFAPTIAAMLGGPLAGQGVSILMGVLGLTPSQDATKDAGTILAHLQQGQLTGDQIVALKAAEQHHAEIMGQQGIDIAKLNADAATSLNTAIVDDVKDARAAAKGNDKVYDVGLFILASFLIAMIAVLWGCWSLISGAVRITPEMAGMFAAVTGLVGSIVGYFASNAQTVINFLFGGSLTGRKSAENLASNVETMGNALSKAASTPSPTTMIDSTVQR